jgi:hypothetical protein
MRSRSDFARPYASLRNLVRRASVPSTFLRLRWYDVTAENPSSIASDPPSAALQMERISELCNRTAQTIKYEFTTNKTY